MQEQLIQTLLISAKNIGSGLATIGLVGAGAGGLIFLVMIIISRFKDKRATPI